MNISKFVTSVVLGGAVLVSGLGLAALPAQAASVTSESAPTEVVTKWKGIAVGQVKMLQAKRSTAGTSAVVTWKKPVYTGVLSGYLVNVSQKGKIVKDYYISDPSKLAQTITGLKKGLPYRVSVTSVAKSSDKRTVVTSTISTDL